MFASWIVHARHIADRARHLDFPPIEATHNVFTLQGGGVPIKRQSERG